MNSKDKWNRKHQARLSDNDVPTANERLTNLVHYLKGGSALDLACGVGGNSFFLAKQNYQVRAVDISDVAIQYIKEVAAEKQLDIITQVCDLTNLEQLHLDAATFDLVTITYYLDRSLFPFVQACIRENGYFFMETFYLTPDNEDNGMPNEYKLHSQELLTAFKDWKILYYEENEQEDRQTILCQKIV